MLIGLSGSDKYRTGNPAEYLLVKQGKVYVYVVDTVDGVIGRSLFLCEAGPGVEIPTMSVADSDIHEKYQFLVIAANDARIEIKPIGDDNEERKKKFLEFAGLKGSEDSSFPMVIIEWYQGKIEDEKKAIRSKMAEQDKVKNNNRRLMMALFGKSKTFTYEENTDSGLYNVVSVYCHYMNIEMCTYQSLVSSCGDDFSIYDIARMSHFAIRRVKLRDKWYKDTETPLIAFRQASRTPVLCIPKRRGRYVMYDFENGSSVLIEEEEASWLEEDAVVAYGHLPNEKLSLKDVTKYGISHVNRGDMVSFTVMYLFTTLIGLLLPFLNEMFYDDLIPLSVPEPIYQVGAVMLSVMVGNIFFSLVQNLSSFRGVKSVEYSIMAASYDRLFRLPQSFIESFGTMELIGRINAIPGVFSSTVSSGISAVMGMILSGFYLWKMFDKSKPLAFRGLIITVISGVIMYFFGRLRIDPEKNRLKEATDANAVLYQLISGVHKIKISGIEDRGLLEFQKPNTRALTYEKKSTKINQAGNALNIVLQMLYTGIIYYTVVKKRSDLSLGEYSAFNVAYGMFTSAAHQLIGFFLTQANLIPAMQRIQPIFEQEAENRGTSTHVGELSGNIEVDHLDFAYEGETEMVLKDISLKVTPGEYIGIVGPSGCGKSTLLKCLLGFEKATKGKIYFDDKDIDTLDKCDLRRHMGVVLQEGQLVMGNILTNITLSAPDTPVEKVEEILEQVGLKNDVDQMPMGIFTNVSEGGGTVSGGQKQRILIARALANDPKIIMFDEATSALDNVTQAIVCDTLAKHNMTRIMIAHRLSTVKNCDRIVVMDKGSIVETGNFDELMEKKGLFYELAKRQMVS